MRGHILHLEELDARVTCAAQHWRQVSLGRRFGGNHGQLPANDGQVLVAAAQLVGE